MDRYRAKHPSTAATISQNVEPNPAARSQRAPTRYHVEHSVYGKKASHSYTVEAEYRKYVAGETSSEHTDILRFWEVRSTIRGYFERYDSLHG